ncbi:Hypothetical protein NTJ_15932 [Nesidiocoris tenuis]|uniref:Uncharacterized protein n=1 Tax=Nesidiocoris tenuis TaxID=355587 RepID=A0ABN7BFM3_9HEMI|nr:Hypothetical protein NTJ_15932 [Nesidiocoris tenuis]
MWRTELVQILFYGGCLLSQCPSDAATFQLATERLNSEPKQMSTMASPAGNEPQDPSALDPELNDLNSFRRPGGSVAVMKTHSVIYKNVNGEKEQYEQRREEVHKNGEVVARVQQELDKNSQNNEPYVRTMLDIPAKNLHKVIEHGPKHPVLKETIEAKASSHGLVKTRTADKKPFSPLDMAEYVFWTGDERGASSAIEEFLEDGLMSRDEAIVFLEEIKQNLELLKRQYANELEKPRLQIVPQKLHY